MTFAGNISVSPLMQFVRICLVLLSAVLWISGFCLFVIGIWAAVEFSKYDDLSNSSYNDVSVVLIVIGIVIASVGFCGCCGALRKNVCLLKMFAVFLGIIIVCEVCVAIVGYVYRSKIKSALSNGLAATMKDYKNGGVIEKSWDAMQEKFHCCGNNNYTDWFNVTWSKDEPKNKSVPKSCCKDQSLQNCNTNLQNTTKIYTQGCYYLITDFFQSKFSVLASGALGIALIQIIGVGCGGCFISHIQRKMKYELV